MQRITASNGRPAARSATRWSASTGSGYRGGAEGHFVPRPGFDLDVQGTGGHAPRVGQRRADLPAPHRRRRRRAEVHPAARGEPDDLHDPGHHPRVGDGRADRRPHRHHHAVGRSAVRSRLLASAGRSPSRPAGGPIAACTSRADESERRLHPDRRPGAVGRRLLRQPGDPHAQHRPAGSHRRALRQLLLRLARLLTGAGQPADRQDSLPARRARLDP